MCVLSIKVPIRKKFGNLFNDPRSSLFVGSFFFTPFLLLLTFFLSIPSYFSPPHQDISLPFFFSSSFSSSKFFLSFCLLLRFHFPFFFILLSFPSLPPSLSPHLFFVHIYSLLPAIPTLSSHISK